MAPLITSRPSLQREALALVATSALASWLVFGRSQASAAQVDTGPDTVTVTSGQLTLHGLVWRPAGAGPFPAVLFNHGSYDARDSISMNEPVVLGRLFARHGYVFLFLFRQGIGLSSGHGTADGELMARALAAEGTTGRNRVQLRLLEHEELDEAAAGLSFLRALPYVDRTRAAVAGHSFGGSLTLLIAARDTTLRTAVAFAPAAFSWGESPELRARLNAAVDRTAAPVMFIHARNDYSTESGKALAAEMKRLGKQSVLEIYPAVGTTAREGHNLIYRNVSAWERDVFRFLDQHTRPRAPRRQSTTSHVGASARRLPARLVCVARSLRSTRIRFTASPASRPSTRQIVGPSAEAIPFG